MELVLSKAHLAQIATRCEQEYPREACGILLGWSSQGRKAVVEVLGTGNAREESAQHNRYAIPPEDLLDGELRAQDLGLEVIGYFHSHPDHPATPSVHDRELAWPWYSYLITSVHQGRAVANRSWVLKDDHSIFQEETITKMDEPLQRTDLDDHSGGPPSQ